jgi:hypothetical protein
VNAYYILTGQNRWRKRKERKTARCGTHISQREIQNVVFIEKRLQNEYKIARALSLPISDSLRTGFFLCLAAK